MGNNPASRSVSRISDQAIPSKRVPVSSLVDQITDAKLPNLLIYKDAGIPSLLTHSLTDSLTYLINKAHKLVVNG